MATKREGRYMTKVKDDIQDKSERQYIRHLLDIYKINGEAMTTLLKKGFMLQEKYIIKFHHTHLFF